MNVWIVYDSKFGNNKQVAESLAGQFKDGNSVHVHYAKKISPEAVINGGVDLLLVGGPLHFGAPTSTIKRWANRMVETLNQKAMKMKKVAIWSTHMKEPANTPPGQCSWEIAKPKWKVLLDAFPAEKKSSEILGIPVRAISGSDILEAGWQDLVGRFADMVKIL